MGDKNVFGYDISHENNPYFGRSDLHLRAAVLKGRKKA
jgi:hypothetical protein